jgi:hypothetical protein
MIDLTYEFICLTFSFLVTIAILVFFTENVVNFSHYLMIGIFCFSYLIFRNTLSKKTFNSDLPERYRK